MLRVKVLGHFVSVTDTLPETNIGPENCWLEDDPFLLGKPIFRGV